MRLLHCIIAIPILLFATLANGQPGTAGSHMDSGMFARDLSGFKWKMKQMRPGQGIVEGLHELPAGDIETLVWNAAEVPGDVYTDLWKAGVIDDPYFGRNSVRAQWVMHYEWWYTTQFNVTQDLEGKKVWLEFDGVDYSCEVWLNGTRLGSHVGAFSPFSFDVTDVINSATDRLKSQNLLVIKLDPPPQVNAKVAGRKTPWFGDYWRDLIPFGINRPVKMVITGPLRIDDVYANSTVNEDGSADINLEVTLENTGTSAKEITLDAEIQGQNFESDPLTVRLSQRIEPGLHKISRKIQVKNPKLWYPWDLGEPNLYNANVSIREQGKMQDRSETTFGIREVEMEWNPGFSKDEVSFPRTVKINGKTHYIRSACWGGPPDIFVGRTSISEYRELIRLAKEMNLNNIRIFGWHPPEIPEFYQLCNEAGITVWQDIIPLGTGNVPKDQAFLDATIAEAIAVVKERRNNPCLILIEGGEEVFLRTADPKFTNDFLMTLGDAVQDYLDLPYVPDSPLTYPTAQSVGYKPKEAEHALAYFYAMGNWLMEDYFHSLDFPIYPELAITSVPSVESLKKFIPADELWPPGLSWGHHWADLDRLRMQNFDTFDDERTGSLEEFVNASQDAQGIIFQLAVEYYRRMKPRVSGVSLCHFITYWPDMKWGIVDNYQQPKRSFEYVQKGYQPLLVSLHYSKRRWINEEPFKAEIWIVNDFYKSYKNCQVEMRILDDTGNEVANENYNIEKIEQNSSQRFIEVNTDILTQVRKNFTVELTLRDQNGDSLSSNQYMLLIGDQAEARQRIKRMGIELREKIGESTYGNYYRFYPELSGEEGRKWDSGASSPEAQGFEENETRR